MKKFYIKYITFTLITVITKWFTSIRGSRREEGRPPPPKVEYSEIYRLFNSYTLLPKTGYTQYTERMITVSNITENMPRTPSFPELKPPPPPFHWKYIQDLRMTLIHEYYCNIQIDHSRSSKMFWATNSSVILSKIAITKTPATACLVLLRTGWTT